MFDFATQLFRNFFGDPTRPDLQAHVSSGLFDLAIEGVAAFAAAGEEALNDTHRMTLYYCLSSIFKCRGPPACEAKIRAIPDALAFCMEHSLELGTDVGLDTGSAAVAVCEQHARTFIKISM
eukprot:COSAG02_NODE_1363_length_13047_cov_5.747374_9_plen_122_part_00